MGLFYKTIIGPGPKFTDMEQTIGNGWIWMVFRRDPKPRPDGKGHDWHIQGVASTEGAAIEMCADSTYFIGPIPIDTALPHNRMEWAGSYFPLHTTDEPNPSDDPSKL